MTKETAMAESGAVDGLGGDDRRASTAGTGDRSALSLTAAVDAIGELLARIDLDLAVDVAKVPRNRVSGHERLLSDFPVRHAVCGELRHPQFCRSERLNARDRRSTRSSPSRHQLLTYLRLESRRAAAVREVQRDS